MKVKVTYTVEVDDAMRREINHWYGRPGLATRQEVHKWYQANGLSGDDDLAKMVEERKIREESS